VVGEERLHLPLVLHDREQHSSLLEHISRLSRQVALVGAFVGFFVGAFVGFFVGSLVSCFVGSFVFLLFLHLPFFVLHDREQHSSLLEHFFLSGTHVTLVGAFVRLLVGSFVVLLFLHFFFPCIT